MKSSAKSNFTNIKNANETRRGRSRQAMRAARSAAPKIEWLEARQLLSTYTVNSLFDEASPGPGVVTLRQAVAAAKAHAGADTINFAASLFPGSTLQTLQLQQDEIDFTDTTAATTVIGPGAAKLAIDGNKDSRIFGVSKGVSVSLSGMKFFNGQANIISADGNSRGGAIDNQGTLTVTSCTFTANALGAPSAGHSVMGGAIYSSGPLTIQSSTFSSNNPASIYGGVSAFGGAIYSTAALKITGSTFSGNSAAGSASGGAIFASGPLTIDSSTFSGNFTAGRGGAINAGSTTTINTTTISGNHANSGSNAYGGGIFCSGNLTITSSKITQNSVSNPGAGGGIYCSGPLTLVKSEVSENTISGILVKRGSDLFAAGGGIYAGGTLALSGSFITNNSVGGASSQDGGWENPGQPGGDALGGGIYAHAAAQISTTVVTGNTVTGGDGSTPDLSGEDYNGGSGGNGLGGGIYADSTLTLTNSTVSQNSATGGHAGDCSAGERTAGFGGNGQGGGIYAKGPLSLANSTISQNKAVGLNGGDNYQLGRGGNGGNGIGGGVCANSTLTLVDSTVSGNNVVAGEQGWGHYENGQATFPGYPGVAIGPNVSVSGATVDIQAKPGGPYSVNAGNALQLDASKSVAPSGSVFSWDVNGDSVYGDATGKSPKLTWAQLIVLHLQDGVYNARVRITTGSVTAIATTTLTVHAATVAQIFGTVFNDLNANGIAESSEPKVAGRTVYLDANNNAKLDVGEVKTVTDSKGQYIFANLKPGTYRIREVLPAGWRQTAPLGNTAARVATLLGGQNVTVSPIGATQAAVITGTMYNDLNSNGVFDSTEKRLANWQVYIDKNNNGVWDKGEFIVTTDSKGVYTMVVKPGTYRLREVRQNGWTRTQPAGAWPLGYYDVTVAAGQLVSGRNFGNHL